MFWFDHFLSTLCRCESSVQTRLLFKASSLFQIFFWEESVASGGPLSEGSKMVGGGFPLHYLSDPPRLISYRGIIFSFNSFLLRGLSRLTLTRVMS